MPDPQNEEQIARALGRRVEEIDGCTTSARLQPGRTFNGPRRASVADFGAVADGTTDDTVAIQRAVDHLLAESSGILVFPPGRYLVDSVACGPGITFWGYGATLVKPGIRFYCHKHLRAAGVALEGDALERRLDDLEVIASKIEQATVERAIATLRHVLEATALGRDPGLDDPEVRAAGALLGTEELEALRHEVEQLVEARELTDRDFLELMEQTRGGRNQAKWARTFHTGDPALPAPVYRYVGNEDSPPLVFMGLRFDGNRRRMGRYDHYELEQQHMIFLAADTHSRGRLRAWVRDVCMENGVGDGISVYRNVDVTIRNVIARDVFRGAVTCTGGNSRIDVADVRAGGDDHPTGIDWEVDGGSFVRDGEPTATPNFRTETVASNLILDGDFDLGLRGGRFEGDGIRVLGPPFHLSARGDSQVVIRRSSFVVGNVLASSRTDDIGRGRYVSVIRHPHDVLFEDVEFVAALPAPEELRHPLAYYSLLVLTMTTRYFEPHQYHLHFRRCRFRMPDPAPDGAETRGLSTNNDLLDHGNGTLLERCSFDRDLDYALHVGGGQGGYGVWGAAGGGYFRFVDTEVGARVAAFVGGNERYRTYADLRGVVEVTGFEHLVDRPEGQDDAWVTILR